MALLVGLVPMFTKKGGKPHIQSGRVYFAGMTLVFLTAIPLSLIQSNYFLFSVGIFSYYAAFSGFRYARRKAGPPLVFDQVATAITILTGLGMISFGGFQIIAGTSGMGIVLFVFGAFAFWMSLEDGLRFWRSKISSRYGDQFWFFNHFQRIGGSYIAAFTAFAVTNLHFLPDLVGWLGPTVVGTVLITRSSRHYAKKFSLSKN